MLRRHRIVSDLGPLRPRVVFHRSDAGRSLPRQCTDRPARHRMTLNTLQGQADEACGGTSLPCCGVCVCVCASSGAGGGWRELWLCFVVARPAPRAHRPILPIGLQRGESLCLNIVGHAAVDCHAGAAEGTGCRRECVVRRRPSAIDCDIAAAVRRSAAGGVLVACCGSERLQTESQRRGRLTLP